MSTKEADSIENVRALIDQRLALPDDAREWVLSLWNLTQVMDDVWDGSAPDRGDLERAIWDMFVGMGANRFYITHRDWLDPACAQMVLRWQAANVAEDSGDADERSYMWRAGFYDVLLMVACIVHGPSSDVAHTALSLYGETAESYLKEFAHGGSIDGGGGDGCVPSERESAGEGGGQGV